MRGIKLILCVLFLGGTLGASAAFAADSGVLFKARLGTTNYCHMKFPAIREDTLRWAHPVLKDPNSGDIIDFYGSCDHNPTGKAEAWHQYLQYQRAQKRAQN